MNAAQAEEALRRDALAQAGALDPPLCLELDADRLGSLRMALRHELAMVNAELEYAITAGTSHLAFESLCAHRDVLAGLEEDVQ